MSKTVGKLKLDQRTVKQARQLARKVGKPIVEARPAAHHRVGRARHAAASPGCPAPTPRALPGPTASSTPCAPTSASSTASRLPVWDALRRGEATTSTSWRPRRRPGRALRDPRGPGTPRRARGASRKAVHAGIRTIDARRRRPGAARSHRLGDPPSTPWIYLIVATGDIYEDIPQAQAAARAGADVIAVIRSTGQSLLDFVPEGATREGFAGTYATQENFRLMRAALDETSRELGRYVRLTNYASGLCMPEIAALAGLERLDMMLNDSMYGILFRDINPIRTFVDQRFSRQVHARAGIIINTGEDNYLTTADAVEAAHTVTTSQLLNEYFAKEAGLEDWQLGLGHAFEINPDRPESFRLELAHAHAGARAVPRGAAEVDAADPPHDRRRVPRLPARRLLQPRRRAHGSGHPAGRHDDRGRRDALDLRPRPGAPERPLRHGRGRRPARGLPAGPGRLHRAPGPRGARRDHRAARRHRRPTPTRRATHRCWRRSPTAPSA